MVQRWITAYGLETADAICRYDQLPPPMTIRLNSPDQQDLQLEPGFFVVRARRIVAGEVTTEFAFRMRDRN